MSLNTTRARLTFVLYVWHSVCRRTYAIAADLKKWHRPVRLLVTSLHVFPVNSRPTSTTSAETADMTPRSLWPGLEPKSQTGSLQLCVQAEGAPRSPPYPISTGACGGGAHPGCKVRDLKLTTNLYLMPTKECAELYLSSAFAVITCVIKFRNGCILTILCFLFDILITYLLTYLLHGAESFLRS